MGFGVGPVTILGGCRVVPVGGEGVDRSKVNRRVIGVCALLLIPPAGTARAADLAASHIQLAAGATGSVEVSGNITGDSTYGYTLLVELTPRAGALGTVTFTPAPPVDIVQLEDAWQNMGTFTPFDTNTTGSLQLDGAVDDDGGFLGNPLTFTGPLVRFPVVASADAAGIWDVLLSTSAGDSRWEEVGTALAAGSITILGDSCVFDANCDDDNLCTDDQCNGSICEYTANTLPCDDGLFCTGIDTCTGGQCVGAVSPCLPGQVCDEVCDTCVSGSCLLPTAVALGGRTFTVTPADGTQPVALRVNGMSSNVSCVQARYIASDGRLQDTPVFLTPAQWQTVYPRGSEIPSDAVFSVATECEGEVLSSCVPTYTYQWGDANDSGHVNLDDILLVLSGFSGNFAFAPPEAVDWAPCAGSLNGITINLDDILITLAAFSGGTFDDVCPAACP